MSEEKDSLSHAAETETHSAQEQTAARPISKGQQKRRQKSVFQYITVLFGAAFVLLLITFMMEKRTHEQLQQENQEQINNLQQSVSAVQSLNNLVKENDDLKEQVKALEKQVAELEHNNGDMTSMVDDLSSMLERTKRAMDYFWQIDEAYVRGKYSLCRKLIQEMEDVSQGPALKESLPRESVTDNGRFSPADRYQEIYDRLF